MDPTVVTGARNWAGVRANHPELVGRLELGLGHGDPAADAVIAEMHELGLTWPQLIAMVESDSGDLPPAARRLYVEVSTPPPWFDSAVARAGARAWWRFGTLQSSTLYQSLIYGYKAQGFVRPLVATGRLTGQVADRVQGTGRWVAEATTPGSMAPGAPGWVATIRIRLLHALIRDHLVADRSGTGAPWDVEEWGVPINQTYSALTISGGFLALPLIVAHDFGIQYSSADREAITHLWRWIGWVIGVDPDLLPTCYAEAQDLFAVAADFELEPDSDSRDLTRALLREGFDLRSAMPIPLPGPMISAMDLVMRPLLSSSFSAISTRWVEDPVAGKLGLRRTPLHHLVDVARPAVRLREVVRVMGFLGSESRVVDRELRTVRRGLGLPPTLAESAPPTEPSTRTSRIPSPMRLLSRAG
ncbi:oxygenase MpaB family protein [Gordonia soli]|nr:oxygenase MpaB family protein [Gordonia soli]